MRENPRGGQHLPHPAAEPRPGWCWYDRTDCNSVTTADLAASASFAVANNTVVVVPTSFDPEVTLSAGYDPEGHGLVDEPRRYPTIHPDELTASLDILLDRVPDQDSDR